MGTSEEIAPEVRSILDAARERADERRAGGAGGRVSVDPRSLPEAFAAAEADGRVPLIAEVKPTSPTTPGRRDDDPVELAREMVEGGAAALSVLTEPEHFGGSTETLERVRAAVDVPVLRKDFVVREAQLDAVEADAVLLIVRFLDEPGTDDLADLLAAARDRGFQVLVEAHTREEARRALDAGATTVGVNNRDLAQLDVDLGTFEAVAPAIRGADGDAAPDGAGDGAADDDGSGDVTLVAESGIETTDDAARMRAAGADALLVGSAIMDVSGSGTTGGHGDVRENTRRLATAATDTRTETQ
ncbi:MAG: indole-3-glycerol phosphate synthase [Haloarculaceae archaeon]